MDAEDRAGRSGLIRAVLKEAPRFSFFQIVHLLDGHGADLARVGYQGPASEEFLRFRPVKGLAFQSADVAGVEVLSDHRGRERYVVETTFLGLYGTSSPLPSFYTEEMLHEASEESLVRGFLDIFNHRILSLFFRCWEKYRHYVQYRDGARDGFSLRLFHLIGLGSAPIPSGSVVPKERMLRYAGLLLPRSRPAASLRAFLGDYFDRLPAQVESFAARWVNVPADLHNRLGASHAVLGEDLHLGERVLDRSGKFRVLLGPLGLTTFLGFLPRARDFQALDEIVHLFVTDQLDYDVELILRKEEVPDLRLAEGSPGTSLGQTTWIGRPSEDPRVVIRPPKTRAASNADTSSERRAASAAA